MWVLRCTLRWMSWGKLFQIYYIHTVTPFCEFSDVPWGLNYLQKFSHIPHIYKVSFLCECSDVHRGVSSGRKFSHIHDIHKVFLLCEFSRVHWGMISERRFSHTHNIHRASHLCESSDVYWGVSSGQMFSEIHYICRVSPQCEFSEVLLLREAHWLKGFHGGSDGKESTCNAGDLGSIPGLGGAPGGEYGYPLQCSWMENSMDRVAWRATIHRVAQSWTWLKCLSTALTETTHPGLTP